MLLSFLKMNTHNYLGTDDNVPSVEPQKATFRRVARFCAKRFLVRTERYLRKRHGDEVDTISPHTKHELFHKQLVLHNASVWG